MDAAAEGFETRDSHMNADLLLLQHCFALDPERRRPPARLRLEELLGGELARRLVGALCTVRRGSAAA